MLRKRQYIDPFSFVLCWFRTSHHSVIVWLWNQSKSKSSVTFRYSYSNKLKTSTTHHPRISSSFMIFERTRHKQTTASWQATGNINCKGIANTKRNTCYHHHYIIEIQNLSCLPLLPAPLFKNCWKRMQELSHLLQLLSFAPTTRLQTQCQSQQLGTPATAFQQFLLQDCPTNLWILGRSAIK